jgi:uncharacterized protein YcbX
VHLAEIWRYPVKSMAGERLEETPVGAMGIPGDRALVVLDGAGRVQDGRTRPGLLRHRAAEWEGRYLAIGSAVIGLADLRGRCIMTTWDPDTGEQDAGVLRRIVREFDGTFALNAWVARAGNLAEGDPVRLLDRFEGAEPPRLGRYAR